MATSVSIGILASTSLYLDAHVRLHGYQTSLLVGYPVHNHQAIKAQANAAEEASRPPLAAGRTEGKDACRHQRGPDGLPWIGAYRLSFKGKGKRRTALHLGRIAFGPDRKSTRLNSSHRCIS